MKVAIVLTVLLFACSASYLALAEPKNSPKPQEVFGSYWTAEPGWHTEFQLRNKPARWPANGDSGFAARQRAGVLTSPRDDRAVRRRHCRRFSRT